MVVHLVTHHLPLTPSLRDFAVSKISDLAALAPGIVAAQIVLSHEHSREPAGRFGARVRLAVRGPDVYAHDLGADLYATIDCVVDKLARRLRKRKTRLHRHVHAGRSFGVADPTR